MQKAISRIKFFEAPKRCQGFLRTAEMPETYRFDEQEIAILRSIRQQRPDVGQRLGVQVLFLQLPQPVNVLLECSCGGSIHRDPRNNFGGRCRPPKHNTVAQSA